LGGGALYDVMIQEVNKTLPFVAVGNSGNGTYQGNHSIDVFPHKKIKKREHN